MNHPSRHTNSRLVDNESDVCARSAEKITQRHKHGLTQDLPGKNILTL